MNQSFLHSKILIVDDEVEVCNALKEFLTEEQYTIEVAHDGEQALEKVESFKPHCILLDIRMPHLNGVEALKMIKRRKSDVAVIMVTAVSNIKMAEGCMRSGAYGYITKPVDLDYLLKEIQGALYARLEKAEKEKRDKDELDHLIEESKKFKSLTKVLNKELYNSLKFPFKLIEFCHPEFGCHCQNVAWIAKKIAEQMKLKHIWHCELASYYHDIGKLSFPRHLWGGFSDEWSKHEKEVYTQFPIFGQEIVQSHPELGQLGQIIRHQCENFDGTGFPDKIAGDQIPIESRIIAVANAFDEIFEMGSRRNIEQDMVDGEKALDVINKDVNKKFDPSVVQALSEIIENLKYKASRETKIPLNKLAPKMRLSRDLITKSGKLAVSRDTTLNPTQVKKLNSLNKIDPVVSDIFIYS